MPTIEDRDSRGRNRARDITGMRSGKLTATHPTGGKCPNGDSVWSALCECGNVVERPSYWFRRQLIQSCGCGPKGRPRIPEQGAHVNALYSHCRTSARVRNLEFSLDKKEFRRIIESPCAYCGTPPAIRPTHTNLSGTFEANGVDRADSNLGYISGNCVSCCSTCNWAKRTMTVAEFRGWIRKVYEHLRLNEPLLF